jgi:hypothetical protein
MKVAMDGKLSRRAFLVGPLPLFFVPQLTWAQGYAKNPQRQVYDFAVDVGVMWDLFTLAMTGTVTEEIDLASGRYRMVLAGEGSNIAAHTDASGIIREGRHVPIETHSRSTIRGREGTLHLLYNYDRGTVEYHSVGYTFFLGRRRQVDDTLKLPAGQRVDDLLSAELNLRANKLDQDPDGTYRTLIVRRSRAENEGPDEVSPSGYRAELVPLRFRLTPDAATGRLNAFIDITGFSSWARRTEPARVTFTSDRRLETVQSKLILGTTFKVRIKAAA